MIVRLAAVACVVLFVWLVARFHDRQTGFTSLLSIGDRTEASATSALRQVHHYTYMESHGYDGAYYVQIALSPLLNDPELSTAIDNLPYRARRILLSWSAWALGFGHPAAIVSIFPTLNLLTWFALAWLLLRWFPLTSWDNLLRWSALLFSQGMCMSVRHSLVDAPSLLLIVCAVRALEQGGRLRGATFLALAVLTKETSVLASAAFKAGDWRRLRTWIHAAAWVAVICLPLALWLIYIRQKLGPNPGFGLNNFMIPLSGLGEKWGATLAALSAERISPLDWVTLACTLSLTVQIAYLLLRWRPAETWWRVGVGFAVMALFLGTPVWEGSPGAAARVLLPMSLAFNILVPAGRRGLTLLVAGNLSVLSCFSELTPPTRFYAIAGTQEIVARVEIDARENWYGVESRGSQTWRWTSGNAHLIIRNENAQPVVVTFEGGLSSLDQGRTVAIKAGDEVLWSSAIGGTPTAFQFERVMPPGETSVEFTTNLPALPRDADNRSLAFSLSNLKLTFESAPSHRP